MNALVKFSDKNPISVYFLIKSFVTLLGFCTQYFPYILQMFIPYEGLTFNQYMSPAYME